MDSRAEGIMTICFYKKETVACIEGSKVDQQVRGSKCDSKVSPTLDENGQQRPLAYSGAEDVLPSRLMSMD